MPLSYLILSYHRPDPPAIGPTRDPPREGQRRHSTTSGQQQPLKLGQFRDVGASRHPNGLIFCFGRLIGLPLGAPDHLALLPGDVLLY